VIPTIFSVRVRSIPGIVDGSWKEYLGLRLLSVKTISTVFKRLSVRLLVRDQHYLVLLTLCAEMIKYVLSGYMLTTHI